MSTIKDQIEKAAGKSASEITEMVTKVGEGSFSKVLNSYVKMEWMKVYEKTINVAKEMIKNSHATDITKGIGIGAGITTGFIMLYKRRKMGGR